MTITSQYLSSVCSMVSVLYKCYHYINDKKQMITDDVITQDAGFTPDPCRGGNYTIARLYISRRCS